MANSYIYYLHYCRSPGHTVPPQPFGPSGPNMTANDSASASQQDIQVKLIERQIEVYITLFTCQIQCFLSLWRA